MSRSWYSSLPTVYSGHHGYGGEIAAEGDPLLPRDLKESGSPVLVGWRRGDGHLFTANDHYHGPRPGIPD